MIRWLLCCLALCSSAHAASVIPVSWPNPSVAWANTAFQRDYDDHGQKNLRPGRWEIIDLTAFAPAGATHVQLHGILVITHGTNPVQCEIQAWWRPQGQFGTAGSYLAQAVSVVPGGGVRQNHTVLIPVVWKNGKALAEMWYDALPTGQQPYPSGCAWGFTYRAQMFLIP